MHKLLNFNTNFTLILANGEKPEPNFFNYYYQKSQRLLCTDGSANWAYKNNFKPDLIIGDLDSLDKNHPKNNTPILHITDQNTNDLEKCLSYCAGNNWHKILIFGAFGLRADHYITNLLILRYFCVTLQIILLDQSQWAILCPQNIYLELSPWKNNYISLMPLSNHVGPIILEGSEYQLKLEYLSIENRLGTLNKIISSKAQLKCDSPDLLVFLPRLKTL